MTISRCDMVNIEVISNGPKERRNLKERTKGGKHVRMQKGANSIVVSTSLLIGFTFTFFEIFAKQHVY